jgi:hypothetical protein
MHFWPYKNSFGVAHVRLAKFGRAIKGGRLAKWYESGYRLNRGGLLSARLQMTECKQRQTRTARQRGRKQFFFREIEEDAARQRKCFPLQCDANS